MLAGHSPLHDTSDVDPCLMCASHADLDNTLKAQAQSVPVEISLFQLADRIDVHAVTSSFFLVFHSRAPPGLI